MTIKHFADNTDINVYFHMKNHYKKIRDVKSVIDTSAPQGFIKSAPTPPNSDRSWKTCSCDERRTKDGLHLPNPNSNIKRHNCTLSDSKSNASVRSASTPPRPKTRRHPYEMPCRSQWKSRSQSVGLTSRKDVSTDSYNSKIKKKRQALRNKNSIQKIDVRDEKINEVKEGVPSEETNSSINSEKTSYKNDKSISKTRTEEHEYLQFLLRITEDIIVNNFYTSEDVEKVFRNHIEANKERLKMEKMQAQIGRLCNELHIPYEGGENHAENGDCYQNFFENNKHISRYTQHLKDCECCTKRVLQLDNRKDKSINTVTKNDSLESFDLDTNKFSSSLSFLLNKHSLGRVSECTEPTNSIVTLSSKQESFTTTSSFDNVTVLPCFEFPDVGSLEKKNMCEVEEIKEQAPIFEDDVPLTEKEKIGCAEEQIMLDKDTTNSPDQCTVRDELKKESYAQTTEYWVDKEIMPEINEKKVDYSIEDVLDKNQYKLSSVIENDYVHDKKDNTLPFFSKLEHNVKSLTKLNAVKSDPKYILSTIDEKIESGNTVKYTSEKGTQIEVSQCNKECNTDKKLDETSINDNYILINGPVYVLKTVLNTKENVILQESRDIENKSRENVVPEILSQNKIAPFSVFYSKDYNIEPLCPRENQFSKLLNSDYDLTPQRDDNASEKYHHLLKDATTSVTNLNATRVAATNINPDALLLTEVYSLNNNVDNNVILPGNKREMDEEEPRKCQCDQKNNYMFSTNELSSDGQYEIKSYTMPKELNGCVRLSGYASSSEAEKDVHAHDQTTELDVSLSAYEIKSETSNSGKKKSEGVINEDKYQLDELVNVLAAEDDISQASGRSEKSHSSASSATYTKNILGKRKLIHPP